MLTVQKISCQSLPLRAAKIANSFKRLVKILYQVVLSSHTNTKFTHTQNCCIMFQLAVFTGTSYGVGSVLFSAGLVMPSCCFPMFVMNSSGFSYDCDSLEVVSCGFEQVAFNS